MTEHLLLSSILFSLLTILCYYFYEKKKKADHHKLIILVKKFISISLLMKIPVYLQGDNMETKICSSNDIPSLAMTETQIFNFYNRKKYNNFFILSLDPQCYKLNNPVVINYAPRETTNFKSFKQYLCTNNFKYLKTNNYKFYQQLMTKTNLEIYFNATDVDINLAQQYLTYDSKILFFKEYCLKKYIPSDISNSIVKILIYIFDKHLMYTK